jgi:competence ComEA-like helix-hairpin-helix protein
MAEVTQERIQSFAFTISVWICVVLSVGFALSGFVVLGQSRRIQLDDRINPNNTPAASLIRLPGIGFSRAEAIVAYRNNHGRGSESILVFRDCNDLQKVRGIGPRTVEFISEWLKFD